MNRVVSTLFVVCLLAGGVFVATSTVAATDAIHQQQQNGTINVTTEQRGETLTVTLSASGEMAGYQANVTYDPSVVTFRGATGVDFADPVVNNNGAAGWVFLTQAAADGVENPELVQITFEVVGNGNPQIGFDRSNTLLNDADAEVVEPTYETNEVGSFTVATATPTATPSPTVTRPATDSPTATPSVTDSPATADTATPPTGTSTTQSTESGTATSGTTTQDADDGLLSSPLLVGIGVGAGMVLLLGAGVLLGRRL